MKKRVWTTILLLALSAFFIAGCGGGGSDGNGSIDGGGESSKEWKGVNALERLDGDAQYPQIAMNGSGNAMVIWSQRDRGFSNIYVNRFEPNRGWSGVDLLEHRDRDAYYPNIAMNSLGDALAVWQQYDGSHQSIYAKFYSTRDGAEGWEVLQTLLENIDTSEAAFPQVVLNDNLNGIVAWMQGNGISDINLISARFIEGRAWDDYIYPLEETEGMSISPSMAMDSRGNAIAVWRQEDESGNKDVYANIWLGEGGWSSATRLEFSSREVNGMPQVAVDGNGNAIAVWSQKDERGYFSIYANRYEPGSGWSGATVIENINRNAYTPQISMNSRGDAIVIWKQVEGAGQSVYAKHYIANRGWEEGATAIDNRNGDVNMVSIAINSRGDAIAAWQQVDNSGDKSIFANYYSAQSGWGNASTIEYNRGEAKNPKVAIDSQGNAIVVWNQQDNRSHWSIYSNRFSE